MVAKGPPRLRSVGHILLVAAALLLVLWSVIHVVARNLRDDRAGRDELVSVLYWGDAQENQIVTEMVAAFEQSNPRVRVQRIHVDNGNFAAKLKTMIAAGDPPDVFYLPSGDVSEYASLGMLEPMDSYVTPDKVPWASDFYPVLLETFSFDTDTQTLGEGPLWGLPKDFTPVGMYVNTELFEQAGVPVPLDGWTWDEFEAAIAKIDALGPDIHGGFLGLWPDTLRAIVWSHGGEFFKTDANGRPVFSELALDQPETVAALERIRRLRLEDGTVYNATGIAKDGGQEFFTGRVGVIGPLGRWMTPRYRTIDSFRFDFVPLPHTPGIEPTSPTFTTAWAVAAESKQKDAAVQLAIYLASPPGQKMIGETGLAIPALKSIAESDAFLQPGQDPQNTAKFLEIAETGRTIPWPRQRELIDIINAEQSAALQLGSRSISDAMSNVEQRWADELASPLKKDEHPTMVWWPILGAVGVVVALSAGLLFLKAKREQLGPLDRVQERAGFSFIGIWVLGFVALTAGPMLLSAILALTRWSAVTPLGDAEFVGAGNFVHMLRYDPAFWKSLVVTAYYVILAIPLGQAAALAVALLMNAEVRGIAVFRTIFFIPSVITGVALGTLWLALLNNDYGLINEVLRVPLGWVGLEPPDWFGTDAQWAAIPAFVLMSLWGVGGAMVIYLAGLKGIPRSLYEAATIDGASPWGKLINVTLPMLSPLIFFNLVMGIIGSFQVFTQAFVMTGRGPDDATLFYVLNLYLQAFEFHNMGYASALAWVLFAIILAVTLLAFRGSRKLVHYEGLKA